MSAFQLALTALRPPDMAALAGARMLQDRLIKPAGSLGRIEDLGVQLAGIAGRVPPPVPEQPAVAVFAADHGVVRSGVTPWPQEVTAQMVANFCAGGAAISVLARQHGARLVVVDVGVASPLTSSPGLLERKVRPGTDDFADGPAMSVGDASAALDVGADVANTLIDDGADLLVTGDMGIGNTTASAALIAWFTGTPPARVTGRGTGIDDEMLAVKTRVIDGALDRLTDTATPTQVLAEVGGLEIAALAGFIVAGVARRVPVVLDGVIALAAACVAHAYAPGVELGCVAGHRSPEPGSSVALAHLGLDPLIDLGLRLGEGSGACLAVPLVRSAALVLNEMATFDGAGVSGRNG
ncbi:MAG TPA: nicotinate-nucleotide--dimethylbenzimidazole phosphoribosyltransferase [Ilumatobacteraceae bacterium]